MKELALSSLVKCLGAIQIIRDTQGGGVGGGSTMCHISFLDLWEWKILFDSEIYHVLFEWTLTNWFTSLKLFDYQVFIEPVLFTSIWRREPVVTFFLLLPLIYPIYILLLLHSSKIAKGKIVRTNREIENSSRCFNGSQLPWRLPAVEKLQSIK